MTKRLDKEKLYITFVEEICNRAKQIDPEEEQDWFSLSLGWTIAKGFSPAQAHNFALYARYDRHYEP